MKFSRRTEWESGESEWSQALREARGAGRELVDLAASNPTVCGLGPAAEEVLPPLSDARALRYAPEPLGMVGPREAVARYYRDHGAEIPPDQICLTTSTSEAYSYLFRLLCDPGDEVLVAQPSYPLFDLLAELDDAVLRSYPLFYEPGAGSPETESWRIDLHALEASLGPRTRALIVVHPNNPTGNFASVEERRALRALCAQRGIALIADEVFLDYAIEGDDAAEGLNGSFAEGESPCLCFTLSGLSKVCALPQMKLSWIAASGPEGLVRAAMERIEIVADTFLSVSAPAQFALSHWLGGRAATQERIRARLRGNLQTLDRRLAGSLGGRLGVQGGWTVVLRVPSTVEGVEFAVAAMRRGAVVQPGRFYRLSAGHCVASLLTPPELWERGLGLLPLE